MSGKVMTWITLIMTICFLMLGGIFKRTAEEFKGIEVYFGAIVNGELLPMFFVICIGLLIIPGRFIL